jgi:hypothetical protein
MKQLTQSTPAVCHDCTYYLSTIILISFNYVHMQIIPHVVFFLPFFPDLPFHLIFLLPFHSYISSFLLFIQNFLSLLFPVSPPQKCHGRYTPPPPPGGNIFSIV